MTIDTDFEASVAPYRGELLAHCYRMMGSVHDAEDVLQETLVRAWRARDRYDERRASLRTWLYRIATNACLNALDSRSRRPLPSGLVGRNPDPTSELTTAPEVPWLEPFPDTLFGGDPATIAALRNSLRLALVAALQVLPARQRAILVLRDVLEWPAADVAAALSTTVAAVNSALKRARASLAEADVDEDGISEPDDPARRAILDRYTAAFEAADVEALTRLLTEDVVLEMPPFVDWFTGRPDFARMMELTFRVNGTDRRLVQTGVNGQPALAAYSWGADGRFKPSSLHVLTATERGISRIVVFIGPELFPGLLPELDLDDAVGAAGER